MTTFSQALKRKLITSSSNYYKDNYDFMAKPKQLPFKKRFINQAKRVLFRKPFLALAFRSDFLFQKIFLGAFQLEKYLQPLSFFYDALNDETSKQLMVDVMAFKIMGFQRVRLPLSTPAYWDGVNKIAALSSKENHIKLNCYPWELTYFDLNEVNIPVKLYLHAKAIYTVFSINHYTHTTQNGDVIGAEPGDVVLDLGGCFGDTSLYFAEKAGPSGHVYSFEFIPGNLAVFQKNLALNPGLSERITIVENPVWDQSDLPVFYSDNGPGSKVAFKEFEGSEGESTTLTIDDFVEKYKLSTVSMIKTDIEGAEPFAIAGATKTLKQFKPRLAISIYHNMDDFSGIIKQIDDLGLGYTYYVRHATIHNSETVLICV